VSKKRAFHTHLFRNDQGSPDASPHALTMLGANEAPAAVRLEAGNFYPLPCGRGLHGVVSVQSQFHSSTAS